MQFAFRAGSGQGSGAVLVCGKSSTRLAYAARRAFRQFGQFSSPSFTGRPQEGQ